MHRVVLSLTAAAATVVAAATTLHGQAPDAPGGIRGRVLLGAPAAAHAHRATLVDPPSPQADTAPEPPRAVVYLEVAPQLAFEDVRPGRARLDQRGERFVPHVLAIRAGTTVDFPNNDRTYHNVFSLSKARRFDLGRYSAGESRAVRFDRPGIVRVFCDIHSHMNAFILVFSHPYFAVTDADGRFDLGRVPPGEYRLAIWHEGTVRETRTVRVRPAATTAVEVDLR